MTNSSKNPICNRAQKTSLNVEQHSFSITSELGEEVSTSSKNGLNTSTYVSPMQEKVALQETEKKATSPKKHLRPVLVNQQRALSTSQQADKMRLKQEASLANEIKDELNEEQLTPVFKTRAGIQVQFVTSTPYATIDRHRDVIARPRHCEAAQQPWQRAEATQGVAIHYPQRARIVDRFGMTYYVAVRYEKVSQESIQRTVSKRGKRKLN